MRLRRRHEPTVPIRRLTMKVKEAFWDEIEEQYEKVIAPQEDRLEIPTAEFVEDAKDEDGYPF